LPEFRLIDHYDLVLETAQAAWPEPVYCARTGRIALQFHSRLYFYNPLAYKGLHPPKWQSVTKIGISS
jgi:hypothetical protein